MANPSFSSYPLPPGRFGLPFLGETLGFIFDPNFAQKRQRKYGEIFKTKILGRPTVVMTGAEANKFLLASHMDHFSWRDGWPANFRELLGESLFLQEGEEHRRNRKLLMPAFHGAALSNYISTMESIITDYLEKWANKKILTWFPAMKHMTFEIASVLLLGSQPGEMTDKLSQWFTELTRGLFAFPLRLPATTYSKALAARDRLLAHIEQAVIQRQTLPTGKTDTLSLLLASRDEAGNGLSIDEIKVQALLMLFAGHETTTSMLTSFCLAVGQNPEIEKKLREEQAQFATSQISLENLKQMTYLDWTLKEVERMYPPISGGFRGVVKPFIFKDYYVPAGWMALYRIADTHRDSNIYSQPEKFEPERFSPARAEDKKVEYSLVGFGGGSRICLGMAFAKMEMKIFATLLLRNYTWQLLPKQNLTMDAIPTLHPRSGLKVLFRRK
ncbi:MAG: cytochrome P450 [Cyanobacteria bacterium J083]|nr:MAG: cytochrome P450 [Cyanobacteria bacterium J083]